MMFQPTTTKQSQTAATAASALCVAAVGWLLAAEFEWLGVPAGLGAEL